MHTLQLIIVQGIIYNYNLCNWVHVIKQVIHR